MVEAGEVAVAAAFGLGLDEDHRAGVGGANRRPAGDGDVDPLVDSLPPKREPKPETTGPSTGQIKPLPLPPWIGPAGSGAEPVPASVAAISAWIEATSPSSSCSAWS